MRARERGRREEPRAPAAARRSRTLSLHAAGAGRAGGGSRRRGGRWPASVVVPGRRRGVPAAAPPLAAAPAGEPGAGGASRPARPYWAGGDSLSGSFSSQRWQSGLGRRRSCGAGRRRWRAPRTAPQPIDVQSRSDVSPPGRLPQGEATPRSCKTAGLRRLPRGPIARWVPTGWGPGLGPWGPRGGELGWDWREAAWLFLRDLAADHLSSAAAREQDPHGFPASASWWTWRISAPGNSHFLQLNQDHWCGRWNRDPGAGLPCGAVRGCERRAQAGCKMLIWTGCLAEGTLPLGVPEPNGCFWLARFSIRTPSCPKSMIFQKHLLATFLFLSANIGNPCSGVSFP